MNSDHELERLRQNIDAVDLKILELLNERATCALEIGRIKEKFNISIENQERENEIIARLSRKSRGPLPGEGTKKIFQTIIAECRELQKKLK